MREPFLHIFAGVDFFFSNRSTSAATVRMLQMLMYHVQIEIREIKIQGCIIGGHTHMKVSNQFLKIECCMADSMLTTNVKAFVLELY